MTIISASSFAKNFEDRKREVLPQIQSSISDPDVSEHPFDESVCKELESYIIGNNISTASTRESHNLIQSFLDRLKRFVGEQGFDNMGFVSVHKRIHRELSYIWCWVKNEPQSEKVGKMFKFSTKMFLSMTEAAEIFRFYSIDTRYHYLVRNIAGLNIRLLTLFNSEGEPDPLINGFRDTVITYLKVILAWKEIAEHAYDTPFNVWIMFDTEMHKANQTLMKLARYIPKHQSDST